MRTANTKTIPLYGELNGPIGKVCLLGKDVRVFTQEKRVFFPVRDILEVFGYKANYMDKGGKKRYRAHTAPMKMYAYEGASDVKPLKNFVAIEDLLPWSRRIFPLKGIRHLAKANAGATLSNFSTIVEDPVTNLLNATVPQTGLLTPAVTEEPIKKEKPEDIGENHLRTIDMPPDVFFGNLAAQKTEEGKEAQKEELQAGKQGELDLDAALDGRLWVPYDTAYTAITTALKAKECECSDTQVLQIVGKMLTDKARSFGE